MKAPLGLLLGLFAVVLLGGCAANDGGQPDASTAAAAPSTAPTSKAAPSPEPSISLPGKLPKTTKAEPPVDDFQQVVAQGRVRVAGQCVELVTDQVTWVLIGPEAAKLRDGQQAKVTGVPNPNRETACTGSPLLVSQAGPA
jgi:hypothetical protein